jgi:hypothetical protein
MPDDAFLVLKAQAPITLRPHGSRALGTYRYKVGNRCGDLGDLKRSNFIDSHRGIAMLGSHLSRSIREPLRRVRKNPQELAISMKSRRLSAVNVVTDIRLVSLIVVVFAALTGRSLRSRA